MEVRIAKDIDELSLDAAGWITDCIEKVLRKQQRFTWVLAGGNTPKKLYGLLASPEFMNRVPWEKIHFFWGDERYVPFTDDRNNAKMAFETLLSHVPVNPANIHIIRTGPEPAEAAAAYEKLLHASFPDPGHTFDLVTLGLGNNAHTLSLFPGYNAVKEKEKWVISFYLEEEQMTRITLTPPVINAASRVMFLVSGGDKAAALRQVLSQEHDPGLYPAQVIQPYSGELSWWADEAAAADL